MHGYMNEPTRRARFLAGIDKAAPWTQLEQLIAPLYPRVSGAGRRPIGVARMLRMYVAQQCFGLSDEGIEDAIYDSAAIRDFVGVDPTWGAAPDATTLGKFRNLLEAHDLTRQIFETINAHLAARGLMREGTIVDATLIAAPPSTKNQDKQRDPEMHQSKKGADWHFGMKAHMGADAASGLVHSLVSTTGNVAGVTQAHALLRGAETVVLADASYQGVEKRIENQGRAVRWRVTMERILRMALPETSLGRLCEQLAAVKASVREKVEHPFHVIKNLFRHRKTRPATNFLSVEHLLRVLTDATVATITMPTTTTTTTMTDARYRPLEVQRRSTRC